MSTEFIAIDDISEEKYPAIYGKGGLDQFYEAVKQQVSEEVPDLSTKKGRDRIASLAAKVSSSKVAVEKPGREYLKQLKDLPKKIEAELREFVDKMDKLRDETRKPLTDWENAERARIQAHQDKLNDIKSLCMHVDGATSETIRQWLADSELFDIGPSWEEFEAQAATALMSTQKTLREALEKQLKREAEQAAREAEERVRREAEAKAAAEAAENARREADKKHRAKINNEAVDALVAGGFGEDEAKRIVTLVATGKVPNVKIHY